MTCKRATNGEVRTNLLPPEYTARYKQRFNERLLMKALGGLFFVYVLVVAVYMAWMQVESFRYDSKAAVMARLGSEYTNTIRLKEMVRVLQDQIDLQTAALDCYKAVADNLPPELALDGIQFDRGRTLRLNGTGGASDRQKAVDFVVAMQKYTVKKRDKEEPLFKEQSFDGPRTQSAPGNSQMTWNFSCELRRTDE